MMGSGAPEPGSPHTISLTCEEIPNRCGASADWVQAVPADWGGAFVWQADKKAASILPPAARGW